VHPTRVVCAALECSAAGASATEISRQLGIPRRTVADWLRGDLPHSVRRDADCATHAERLGPDYAYLLGLYLGDGCICLHRRGVFRLRLALDAKYPGIIDSAAAAMSAVCPGRVLTQLRPQNYVEVSSYWKCWPCVFPQHGAGRKHERSIELTDWQETLVDQWPQQLIRGLIQSDGCRFQNTGTNWSWPRYGFRQVSDDIRAIFCQGCDRLGVHWTRSRTTIYVSLKADVAILDEFIGPKR
jgi:Homeodomain-like domain